MRANDQVAGLGTVEGAQQIEEVLVHGSLAFAASGGRITRTGISLRV